MRRVELWAGGVLLALALALYLLTLDNGLAPGELLGGDLITHQYAQVEARPSNAPGYPLYTMGGYLWFHGLRSLVQTLGEPLPNPIPILSSYSTLWALLALGLLYALVLRLTRTPAQARGNWPLAFLLGAFYAVTYFFWYYATTTEQYTSAIAQTLAIVYVYVVWSERKARPGIDWTLVLLALLCGLSLAHMLTVAFIVPPLVLAVLWQRPHVLRDGRTVALCVLAAFLPLASYWYVWVRGAAHPEWWGQGEWNSAEAWFWSFVSTAQGRDELGWGFRETCKFFANGFPELIWQELSLPLLLVGLGGIALLRRKLAFVLYGTLAIYLVFNWMYRCANWYQVILPAYPLILLGVAAAANRWQAHFAQGGKAPTARRILAYVPAALLILAIAWRAAASYAGADSAHRPGDTALARAAILLDQPLPPGANLFGVTADALALDYLIHIWGIRPDAAVVSSQEAGERLQGGEAVYSTYDVAPVLLQELPPDLAVQLDGAGADWLALRTTARPGTEAGTEPDSQPDTQPDSQPDSQPDTEPGVQPETELGTEPEPQSAAPGPPVALEQEIVPGVILKGYGVQPAPTGVPVTQGPPAADVTLYWGLLGAWPPELGISLRPTAGGAFLPQAGGEAGAIVQVDAPAPRHGLLEGGEARLADSYRVPLGKGADGILLIVYEKTADGFRNLLELPLELARGE